MKIERQYLTGERALFTSDNLDIIDSTFADGESPLKESSNIRLTNCNFKWKYPLWYCKNVVANNCVLFDDARAGVWYTKDLVMTNCTVTAQKNFRRCNGLTLENVAITRADETLWACENVTLKNVTAKGDYFCMNCKNISAEKLTVDGNYVFDGVENVTIDGAVLITKDAFWNSKNVTVTNSFISGEYLGWNSENLTFINCTVESLQGLCYVKNLVMKNCKLLNTTLSFEYSTVDAEIVGSIDSVKNPLSGRIVADDIAELIMESDKVNPKDTEIILRNAKK